MNAELPPSFVGAWRRRSVSRGGGSPEEPQHVVWIQARRQFADLRLPRTGAASAPTRAFAGHVIWEEPVVTWVHEIDNISLGSVDRGEVTLEGDILTERGIWSTFEGPIPYEEVYERQHAGDIRNEVIVLRTVENTEGTLTGMCVRVGNHQILMIDDRPAEMGLVAQYALRSGEEHWEPQLTLGDPTALPHIPISIRDLGVGDVITLPGRSEVWRLVARS